MPGFLTVPSEYLGHAEVVSRYYGSIGYRLRVEPVELAYPFTPTWTARMGHTLLIVEIQPRVEIERIRTWVGYAKACPRDTRVVIAVPDAVTLKPAVEQELVSLGVGVVVCSDLRAYEKLLAKDQSISIQLPGLRTLPVGVRRILAPTYEKFNRGEWREAFRSGCQVLETEARTHLKEGVSRGRIRFVNDQGRTVNLTPNGIGRLPAGGLARAYGQIVSPNHAESLVEQALKQLNEDRVRLIHYENKPSTETRLRRNVGKHMFVIINALKALR
jgi:hypothetical protein